MTVKNNQWIRTLSESSTLLLTNTWHHYYSIIPLMLSSNLITLEQDHTPGQPLDFSDTSQSLLRCWKTGNQHPLFALQLISHVKVHNGKKREMAGEENQ